MDLRQSPALAAVLQLLQTEWPRVLQQNVLLLWMVLRFLIAQSATAMTGLSHRALGLLILRR